MTFNQYKVSSFLVHAILFSLNKYTQKQWFKVVLKAWNIPKMCYPWRSEILSSYKYFDLQTPYWVGSNLAESIHFQIKLVAKGKTVRVGNLSVCSSYNLQDQSNNRACFCLCICVCICTSLSLSLSSPLSDGSDNQ